MATRPEAIYVLHAFEKKTHLGMFSRVAPIWVGIGALVAVGVGNHARRRLREADGVRAGEITRRRRLRIYKRSIQC